MTPLILTDLKKVGMLRGRRVLDLWPICMGQVENWTLESDSVESVRIRRCKLGYVLRTT